MKRLLPALRLLICLLFYHAGFSQDIARGRVTDEKGGPVENANVVQQKTTYGALTDANGNFTLKLSGDAAKTLEISSVGFTTTTVSFTGSELRITLLRAAANMEEAVVVGYSSQKRSSISGAVSSVNMGDLEQRRVSDVAQALQGQVAGVQITQSTGAPGDAISIRIRGEGTIGNNSPLFIIDGVPSRDISFLAPSDIQSMTVLKDASAAAIYGSRASAGVVVITTKAGKKGRSNIDVNYFNGIQKATNLPKLLDATQYINKTEEAWNNSGYSGTNPYTKAKAAGGFANTNWQDELFETGHSQNLQLSASGGSDKVQYLISGARINRMAL